MTTFRQLLDHFEDSAKTRAAKGKRFEDFVEAYLRTDPIWTEQFDRVWSWQDWPGRSRGHADTGIDLVAREAGTGRTIAIQCKFYSPDATLSWQHVSTFAGMLGQPEFDAGMLISTAGSESDNVWKNLDKLEKQVTPWRVEDFETSRISWSDFVVEKPTQLVLREPKKLREHQTAAIDDVVGAFEQR